MCYLKKYICYHYCLYWNSIVHKNIFTKTNNRSKSLTFSIPVLLFWRRSPMHTFWSLECQQWPHSWFVFVYQSVGQTWTYIL